MEEQEELREDNFILDINSINMIVICSIKLMILIYYFFVVFIIFFVVITATDDTYLQDIVIRNLFRLIYLHNGGYPIL